MARKTTASDESLVAGLAGGDPDALRKLMDRYDRLVRYTIFRASRNRCVQDPDWVGSVASTTWLGFVQSMRRDPHSRPRSLAAYLVRVARNHVVSALRHQAASVASRSIDACERESVIAVSLKEPADMLAEAEELEALRNCLAELDAEESALASQLQAITDRRWRQAAEALGMRESTLRSRWKRVVTQLRACLERKTGKTFAPADRADDS